MPASNPTLLLICCCSSLSLPLSLCVLAPLASSQSVAYPSLLAPAELNYFLLSIGMADAFQNDNDAAAAPRAGDAVVANFCDAVAALENCTSSAEMRAFAINWREQEGRACTPSILLQILALTAEYAKNQPPPPIGSNAKKRPDALKMSGLRL
jgi:hypothetical protein